MSRKALIAANWKMNGAKALIDSVSDALAKIQVDAELLICPPATLLPLFPESAKVALGAQDISSEVSGAYTGQLSAALIKEAGASYVLVGHSERRQYQFESDELVAAKVTTAIAAGLTPVL
ncbi:triose-phosphate isomerase, partial [Alishewanella longhuensis]